MTSVTRTYVNVHPDAGGELMVSVVYWPDVIERPYYAFQIGQVTFYLSKGQLARVADALLDYRSHPECMVLEVTPGHNNPG